MRDGYLLGAGILYDIASSEGSVIKFVLASLLPVVCLLLCYCLYIAVDRSSCLFDQKIGFFILALTSMTEASSVVLSFIS